MDYLICITKHPAYCNNPLKFGGGLHFIYEMHYRLLNGRCKDDTVTYIYKSAFKIIEKVIRSRTQRERSVS